MKANLDEKGCLTIAAESPLESYALTMWFENYSGTDPCHSVLSIETKIVEAELDKDK